MNVVDSSAWLEYFADGPNATFFAPAIAATEKLVVPTLSLYEVFKRVLQQRTEDDALMAMATMQQGTVVDLDAGIALSAARISIDCKLPMADSVMLATARTFEATLWTQDEHFKGLTDVKYRPARGYASGSK
jgi:predicted nucleic acid-binding protein